MGHLGRVLLLRPVALDGKGRAGPRQSGVDGEDGREVPAPHIQPPVFALLAQVKRGVPLRTCVVPARRWAVLALAPMR